MLRTPGEKEPLITLKVGPQHEEVTFLVDTGAERSTIQYLPQGCNLSKKTVTVMGAKGEPFRVPMTEKVTFESDGKFGLGSLLLVPEADYNLLGRDTIIELGIKIEAKGQDLHVRLCPLTARDEEEISPEVWYTPEKAGRLSIEPFEVTTRNPEIPVRVKQYPVSQEGRQGLKPEIEQLLEKGLLRTLHVTL